MGVFFILYIEIICLPCLILPVFPLIIEQGDFPPFQSGCFVGSVVLLVAHPLH